MLRIAENTNMFLGFFLKQIQDEANVKLFPVLFVDTVTT